MSPSRPPRVGRQCYNPHEEATTVPATSAKKQMFEILERQPEDSSYEELLRELAFERMVERGLDDADQGRTISHEEMGRSISSWAK